MKCLGTLMEDVLDSIIDSNQIVLACIACERVALYTKCGKSTGHHRTSDPNLFLPTICMTCESGCDVEDDGDFDFMDAAKEQNSVEAIPISEKFLLRWDCFLAMKVYFDGDLVLADTKDSTSSVCSTSMAVVLPQGLLKFKVRDYKAQSVELVESKSTTSAKVLPYFEAGFF